MPPNELAGKTLAAVLVMLTLIYVVEVRRKYSGPEWARGASANGATGARR
jgi:hypothetical protein